MVFWGLGKLIYGLKLSIIHAIKSLHKSQDGFAILLRPFALDNIRLTNHFASGGWLRSLLGLKEPLEQAIASCLYTYTPLYAVGNPTESHQSLGAMREYFQDETWMNYVDESITQASLIVFIVDKSEFTVWETAQIVNHDAIDKVLFVLPPKKGAAVAYFDSNPVIAKRFGLNKETVIQLIHKGVLLIRSDNNSGYVAYASAGTQPLDYTLAIDTAVATP